MDEYIDIVSQTGEATGKVALKSEAHKHGWYHNTIHVWFYTKNGRILLQQRSHKKKIYPLLWDVSVAGHIDAGESFVEAAIRETKEEIGLDVLASDLLKIDTVLHKSVYDNGNIKDYEFHQVYVSQLKVSINELTPQADEVEALKLVSFEKFRKLLNESNTNNHFIVANQAYYLRVVQHMENKVNH